MATIRVLQVFTAMDRGGSESMIMNYYRHIDREKVQFDFLVHLNHRADFDDEIENMGGKIYRINRVNPFYPKKYYQQLRSFFTEHPEYRIVHSHLNTLSSFPLKIAKEFNIPCRIAHAHIAMDKFSVKTLKAQGESWAEIVKTFIKLRLRSSIHEYGTHYFSCGTKAGRWLFGEDTAFKTMNNAIATEKFSYNATVAKEFRKKLGITDELVIGHVGRFDGQKNHVFIVRIFAALLKFKPNARLILVSDGPFRERIENEAKKLAVFNKIDFLGVRDDVPQLFQMMDFFVFPSFYEGLPVTLIEAQAAGLNILASNTITDEVALTPLIEFLSIEESPEFWAKKISDKAIARKNREDTKPLIVDGGYDIGSNAREAQDFYLQQSKN